MGAVVSTTVTVWWQVALLPHSSVAVHVRVAANVLPHNPLVVVTFVTVTLPHVSLAVGASKVHADVHSTVLSGAHVMIGAVVSTTVTFWLQRALLPQASVASHVRVASKVFPQ